MIATQYLSPDQSSCHSSADSLATAITGALRKTGYRQLLDLQVRVDGHDVILRGRLPSFYLKQLAQHTVSVVPGVKVILDAIDVVN